MVIPAAVLAITAISVIVDPRLGALALLEFGTAPHTNKWDVSALLNAANALCGSIRRLFWRGAIRVSR
jgi:hypothetical protein